MVINAKAKGGRAEALVKDKLKELTGLPFERVPASGALPYLKGDIFVPNAANIFCIEVKHYADSCINDTLLTNKSNNIAGWWPKLLQDCKISNQEPLLILKYDRSKLFVATERKPVYLTNYLYHHKLGIYIAIFEDWMREEKVGFVK